MLIDQSSNVIKLFHYLQILFCPKRNPCRIRSKCRKLVTKDTVNGRDLNDKVVSFCQQQFVLYLLLFQRRVMVLFIKDIQKDVKILLPYRREVSKLKVPFLNIVLPDTHLFFIGDERKNLSCLLDILLNVRSGSNNDVNICG